MQNTSHCFELKPELTSAGALEDHLSETPKPNSLKHSYSHTHLQAQCKKPCLQHPFSLYGAQDQPGIFRTATQGGEQSDVRMAARLAAADAELDKQSLPSTQVCFGMLIFDLPASPSTPSNSRNSSTPTPVTVSKDCTTVARVNDAEHDIDLNSRSGKIIKALTAEEAIALQTFAVITGNIASGATRREAAGARHTLCVNIYGPRDLVDQVGAFASQCKVFLQDPQVCDRNVEYLNPHRMPLENSVFTESLQILNPNPVPTKVEIRKSQDLFCDFEFDEDLADTDPSPGLLKSRLQSHQKKALTFMLRREQGWALTSSRRDIWSQIMKEDGCHEYVNNVTGDTLDLAPPEFRGGILADAMGLGKTLTVIALLVFTVHQYRQPPEKETFEMSGCNLLSVSKPTLVVVPLSLIEVWTSQVQSHIQAHALSWTVFHGSNREKLARSFGSYDVVITTYHTVLSEWKRHLSARIPKQESMHGFTWYRIILDEAHVIRQDSTMLARAIYALEASRRWAVTGTPVQNQLTDLASLFKFLRVFPFDDSKIFRHHVSRSWKIRFDPEAVAKLKTLIKSITIRRPKREIVLPSRLDQIHQLQLAPDERRHYEKMRDNTLHEIDAVVDRFKANNYLNMLQQITRLRLICNQGLFEKSGLKNLKPEILWDTEAAQQTFDTLRDVGQAYCMNCRQDLTFGTTDTRGCADTSTLQPRVSQDLRAQCPSCFEQRPQTRQDFLPVCDHSPRCTSAVTSGITTPSPLCESYNLSNSETLPTSTKINALIESLSEKHLEEKSVVFSYWTTTLDLVAGHLKAHSIGFTRIDGRFSVTRRNTALQEFRSNPGTAVLLVSITCGSVGLDLTAASRAYIIEPQWNPMAEEQALDRIHRMGQRRPVTTIRYIMKDTWEENVAQLQEKKRDLAELVLSKDAIKPDKASKSRLMYLRSLIK